MFSLVFMLLVVEVRSQQTYPYIDFMYQTLASHSYVDITTIGDSIMNVLCITDLTTCCSGTQGSHRGDWYFPNGDRLGFYGDIYEHRNDRRVNIHRSNNASSPTGIYRCDIPTINVYHPTDISVRDTVYVGLYTSSGGNVAISGGVTYDSATLTLTCISTGGPATTVTWIRDSNCVFEGNETVLNNAEDATYTHTLSISTGGEYTCTISNNKPSSATSSSYTVPGASPPTDVRAVQNNATSIKVTWTPPSPLGDITGYRVYTACEGDGVDVSGSSTTSHTLSGLTNGETYTVSVTSTASSSLPSSLVSADTAVGLVPSAAVLNTSPSVGTTTITITGSVSSDSVVTGYVVEWRRDTSVGCSDRDMSIITEIGSFTNYEISGLEPGNRYTVTVIVTNNAGNASVSNEVSAMTQETAPSGAPASFREVSVTSSSITVQWGEVPCLDRNGEITGYIVTVNSSGGEVTVGGGATEATISGLSPKTFYSVSVRANNIAGVGPPAFITLETTDGLTVTASTSTSTSITISWILDDGVTATSYTITYSNNINNDCFAIAQSVPNIAADMTMFTLTGLEEGTQYSITVTAIISGGNNQEDTTTLTTLSAVPSSPPTSVSLGIDSSTSITVEWGPVEPCIDRNGEITGYSVRYAAVDSGTPQTVTVSGDSTGGTTIITGLTNGTEYRVEVAGVTTAGTGVYSDPLHVITPDNVFLSLNGDIIPNHGYVSISDIGLTDSTSLLCHTNNPASLSTGGDWIAPDGTRVSGTGDAATVQGLSRNRAVGVTRLRRTSSSPPEGIYHCSVLDADNIVQNVYVGLCSEGCGQIMLSTLPVSSVTFEGDTHFILTCISTGGPATTVTWTRDSTTITGGQTVLNETKCSIYTHTLTVTSAGEYTCNVSNRVSSHSLTISLEGSSVITVVPPLPVINDNKDTATPSSLYISWTPQSDTTTEIKWSLSGRRRRINADGGSDNTTESSYTITGLRASTTYQITLIHYNVAGPSGPITFTRSTTPTSTSNNAQCEQSGVGAGVIALIGVLVVLLLVSGVMLVVMGIVIFVLLKKLRRSTETATTGLELLKVSGEKMEFQTTSNEAYNVVGLRGRVPESTYETVEPTYSSTHPPPPPASSSSHPPPEAGGEYECI